MPRTFVDLSIYLENDVISDPPAFAPKIQYFSHENTFAQIAPFSRFADVPLAEHYQPAPDDWDVVVTDVRG